MQPMKITFDDETICVHGLAVTPALTTRANRAGWSCRSGIDKDSVRFRRTTTAASDTIDSAAALLKEFQRTRRAIDALHPELPKLLAEMRAEESKLIVARDTVAAAISDARRERLHADTDPDADLFCEARAARAAATKTLNTLTSLIKKLNEITPANFRK